MTEFLKLLGCFTKYLFKYGHDKRLTCSYCSNNSESALLLFFYGQRVMDNWFTYKR